LEERTPKACFQNQILKKSNCKNKPRSNLDWNRKIGERVGLENAKLITQSVLEYDCEMKI
jgi:hypothetical protein